MEPIKLEWYGKLPGSSEFIRSDGSNFELQALDRWFQDGIHHAESKMGTTWAAEYLQSRPWHFLFAPEGASHFLLGVLSPSQDQVGREFPFFVFLRLPLSPFQGRAWTSPLTLAPFLNQANEWTHDTLASMDVDQVRKELATWPVPSLDQALSAWQAYEELARSVTMEEVWRGLFGDFRSPRKYILEASLRACFEPYGSQSFKGLGWALRFPLLVSQTETYDIPCWLDLCSRMAGSSDVPLLLLWQRKFSTDNPSLVVSFGKALSRLVLFLIRPWQQDTAWYDLAPEDAALKASMPTSVDCHRDTLDQGEMSLWTFLSQYGKSPLSGNMKTA